MICEIIAHMKSYVCTVHVTCNTYKWNVCVCAREEDKKRSDIFSSCCRRLDVNLNKKLNWYYLLWNVIQDEKHMYLLIFWCCSVGNCVYSVMLKLFYYSQAYKCHLFFSFPFSFYFLPPQPAIHRHHSLSLSVVTLLLLFFDFISIICPIII